MEWLIELLMERLLQFPPKVYRDGQTLVAVTGWYAHLMCFGFGSRSVRIDPTRKLVRIRKRFLWIVLSSQAITFDRVLYVLTDYRDWSFSQLSAFGAYRDRGIFTVELRLTSGERVMLFRYYSQGDFVNDGFLPDVLYWGDFLEASVTKGNQMSQSEMFAKLAAALIGVRIHSD